MKVLKVRTNSYSRLVLEQVSEGRVVTRKDLAKILAIKKGFTIKQSKPRIRACIARLVRQGYIYETEGSIVKDDWSDLIKMCKGVKEDSEGWEKIGECK